MARSQSMRLLGQSAATLVLVLSMSGLSDVASAQTIAVDRLEDAKAFSPGIDVAGDLPRSAWNGTDAEMAVALLADIDGSGDHPIVHDMHRRVVLAGLSPPSGGSDAFEIARIEAAQALATPDEYARFATRNPAARDPQLRAEAALSQGDLEAACAISDAITQGRGETFWIRIRAACHEQREEMALAELARDLLRDRGESPNLVIPDAPEGFWVEAMALGEADLITFMESVAEWPQPVLNFDTEPTDTSPASADLNALPHTDDMTDGPINLLPPTSLPEATSVPPIVNQDTLNEDEPDLMVTSVVELMDAIMDETDRGTARLFLLGQAGDAKAVSEFVKRAEASGLDPNRVLARIPAVLDPTEMAVVNLPLFARYAVTTSDIPLIQALFVATDNPVLQQRLALASDALGGGYFGQPLGEGLESELEASTPAALGDVMIALGLGASLSERAAVALRNQDFPEADATFVEWLGVDQALDRGAQAETLLRIAALIPDKGVAGDTGSQGALTLYRALRGLRKAGFADLAGRLAAYEFLRGL
ncbi:MAG: hypothetical protein AAF926_04045 [Pseudomonadota bacterium]